MEARDFCETFLYEPQVLHIIIGLFLEVSILLLVGKYNYCYCSKIIPVPLVRGSEM
jgi:hypothetical protein